MLVELKVTNFAIIDRVHIHFEPGFNILSGETGAGKSVLLKSLSLLMGEKASSEEVKAGADSALIEGSFDLSNRPDIRDNLLEMGIEIADDLLIVRRNIGANGKSKVYLNGSLSALNSLRDLISPLITVTGQSAPLIEMTGQHDNRHLQSKAYHLDTLDQFAGVWKDRKHFAERYNESLRLHEQIAKLQESLFAREQRLDFLRFQREELAALNIQPGEDEDLITRMKRLKNISKITQFYEEAEYELSTSESSLVDRLKALRVRAEELESFDPKILERFAGLDQAISILEDTAYETRAQIKDLDADPNDLELLESRYSHFRKLQKKYGETAEHLITAYHRIEAEIKSLESSDETMEQLRKQYSALQLELNTLAGRLHKSRKTAAKEFQNMVNEELRDLNMKGVELDVLISDLSEMGTSGLTHCEFMIRASKKDEPRSLAKYASGGELSRILLSIKQIIGNSDLARTYLFDEVDTGVSGVTAEKVGRKLSAIARGQQVICVTHLAQVAAFADVHFLIEKQASRSSATMSVRKLVQQDRIGEIARLISGEKITRTSLQHAKELIKISARAEIR